MRMKHRMIGAAFLSVLLGSAALPAYAEISATDFYIETAKRMMEKQDFRGARIQLLNAAQHDPASAAVHVELAKLDILTGDMPAAEGELTAAHIRGAPGSVTDPLLAQAYYRSGSVGDLLRDIQPGKRPAASESTVRMFRGLAELSLGHLDNARHMLDDAERLSPKSAEPKVASARRLLLSHQAAAAGAKIQQALAIDPHNSEALEVKGILLFTEGNNSAALKSLNAAIAAEPLNGQALLDRANLYIAIGSDKAAIADIDAAEKISPDSALANYLRSIVAIQQSNFKQADIYLTKIRGQMDLLVEGYFLAGVVKYNLNQLEQANQFLLRYVAQAPKQPKALALLGAIALRRGDVDGAIQYLEQAYQIDPGDAEIVGLLGQAYGTKGDEAKSDALLAAVISGAAGGNTHSGQLSLSATISGETGTALPKLERLFQPGGNILAGPPVVLLALQSQHYDEAVATAKSLYETDPANLYYQSLLGSALLAQRDYAGAEQIYKTVLAKHPDSISARRNLAEIYAATGNISQARALYQDRLAKNPKDQDSIVALAALSSRSGDFAAAVQQLRMAQANDPQNPLFDMLIASNYEAQKDWPDATSEIQQAIKSYPDAGEFYDALGHIRAEAGDIPGSIAAYRNGVAKFPRDAKLWAGLAGALEQSNSHSDAAKAMVQAAALDPKNDDYLVSLVDLTYSASGPDAALAAARGIAARKGHETTGTALAAEVLTRSNRTPQAIALLDNAMAHKANAELMYKLVEIYQRNNDLKHAIATLEDWTAGHPSDFTARLALGQLYGTAGNYSASLKQYEWLSKERPDNSFILNNLAWLYWNAHDPRARATAEKAYTLSPDSAAIADTLGWILTSQGDAAGAIKYLKMASQATPPNPQYDYHLAVALAKVNRNQDAIVLLQRAVKSSQPFDDKQAAQKLLTQLKHQ